MIFSQKNTLCTFCQGYMPQFSFFFLDYYLFVSNCYLLYLNGHEDSSNVILIVERQNIN